MGYAYQAASCLFNDDLRVIAIKKYQRIKFAVNL